MSGKAERGALPRALRDALRLSSLGWDLAVPMCGGALLGHSLDQRFDTGSLLTLLLLVSGMVVGFYNVGRAIQGGMAGSRLDAKRSGQEHSTRW